MLLYPLKYELTQRYNPLASGKRMATERFKLSLGAKDFSLQYSNQAPSVLAGRQLHNLPGGYNLAELILKRKWGVLSAFRSTGYDKGRVRAESARKLSGTAIEVPRSFLGTRLSGYFLHASAATQQSSVSKSSRTPRGSQVLLTLTRDFKKGFKFQSEWTQSWQPLKPLERNPKGNRGLYLNFSGNIAKTETSLTYRSQGEGLSNPAMPAQGRSRGTLMLDMKRGFKKHRFQYSREIDSQSELKKFGLPSTDMRRESLRWTYSPKLLPQLSAAQTWSRHVTAGKQEREENLRLSVYKGMKRFTVGLAYLRGARFDDLAFRSLWDRTGIIGDATVEIRKNRKLNIHYESSDLSLRPTSQLLSSEVLQLNTSLSWFGDKLGLVPALDRRRQRDSRGVPNSTLVNFVLSTLIKIPRYLPGTDILLTFSSSRMSTVARPAQNSAGLVVQWNFKRM